MTTPEPALTGRPPDRPAGRLPGGVPERDGGRLPDRKEAEVRRMLDVVHPPAPAHLAARAMERGERLLHRRRLLHAALWLLLLAVVVAGSVWAAEVWPTAHPLNVTPPLEGW